MLNEISFYFTFFFHYDLYKTTIAFSWFRIFSLLSFFAFLLHVSISSFSFNHRYISVLLLYPSLLCMLVVCIYFLSSLSLPSWSPSLSGFSLVQQPIWFPPSQSVTQNSSGHFVHVHSSITRAINLTLLSMFSSETILIFQYSSSFHLRSLFTYFFGPSIFVIIF